MAQTTKRTFAAPTGRFKALAICVALLLPVVLFSTGDLLGKSDPWRRTVDGWERSDRWPIGTVAKSDPPMPHPALTAAAQTLIAAGLLLGLPNRKARGNEHP